MKAILAGCLLSFLTAEAPAAMYANATITGPNPGTYQQFHCEGGYNNSSDYLIYFGPYEEPDSPYYFPNIPVNGGTYGQLYTFHRTRPAGQWHVETSALFYRRLNHQPPATESIAAAKTRYVQCLC